MDAMIDALNQLDTQLLLMLNSMHSPFWDSAMALASGKLTWLPLYAALLWALVRRHGWRTAWWLLATALVVLLVDRISSGLIKPTVARLRPTHEPAIANLVHTVNGYRGGLYGFVSSHAANTCGVAVLLAGALGRCWLWGALLLWAAFVSYSRIYLGVHYPGDVLCGAALGSGVGLGIYIAFKHIINRYLHRANPT